MIAEANSTLVGVASVIAALASLVSAVASALTHRKMNQVDEDVKKNGNGKG